MTAKKRLIRFMEKKDEILKRNGATIPYFTEDDACSIMQWPDDAAEAVLAQIDLDMWDDSRSCPFCIYHGSHCGACHYGRHHGICIYSSSTYMLLLKQLATKGLASVIERYRKELKKILEGCDD